jgi:hypothetical protein
MSSNQDESSKELRKSTETKLESVVDNHEPKVETTTNPTESHVDEPKSTTSSSNTELTNSDGNNEGDNVAIAAPVVETKLCFVCHGGSATISLLCCMVKCHLACLSKSSVSDKCPSCHLTFSTTDMETDQVIGAISTTSKTLVDDKKRKADNDEKKKKKLSNAGDKQSNSESHMISSSTANTNTELGEVSVATLSNLVDQQGLTQINSKGGSAGAVHEVGSLVEIPSDTTTTVSGINEKVGEVVPDSFVQDSKKMRN